MESSSSGRFDHYATPKPPTPSEGAPKGGGKPPEVDPCETPLPNVRLEEVGRSEYFLVKKTTPPSGTPVKVRKKLVGGRIAVETDRGNQSIGFLPTANNYLLACLNSGHKYKGKVTAAADSPTPRIIVDLFPA
jgi:hypothetical protein